MRAVLSLAALPVATTLGVVWAQQQTTQRATELASRAPAGQRPRPGEGREPEWPAPRITDYKPSTTLVVPEHPRPRAKFPVIDIHSHQPTPISAADFARVVDGMEQINLRLLVNLSGGSGQRLKAGLEAIRASKYPDRMVLFANVDFRDVGPGFGVKAAAALEQDVKAGAKGLKIFKDLGLRIRRTDGTRLKLDDPELDPIWAVCGRLNVPVLIHTAEPQEFFEPINYQNERWLELALYSNRRYPPDQAPRFEELIGERDRMFARHPQDEVHRAHISAITPTTSDG